jgi:hypothetical protein
VHGVLAAGWLAGQPFEPPPDPPAPVVLPPALPPVELPPEPAVVDAAEEPPAPAEPPDELSSPPQLVDARAAQNEVVTTRAIRAAVFIDILPSIRARL